MTAVAILAWSSLVGVVPARTRLVSRRKMAAILVAGTWTIGTAGAGGAGVRAGGGATARASATGFDTGVGVAGDSVRDPALSVCCVSGEGVDAVNGGSTPGVNGVIFCGS